MRFFPAFFFMMLLVASCAPAPHGSMEKFLSPSKTDFVSGELEVFQNDIKETSELPVIFVHGTPGNARNWAEYLSDPDLSKRFRLVAYDRPGFGGSTRGFEDLDTQVEALGSLLDQQKKPAILVGHSLGGAIILGAAARFPDKIHSVIALAPSADTEPGYVLRMNKFLRYSGLDWVLFHPWRVSHLEVLATYPFLEKLQGQLAKITVPVTVVQGTKDRLVPATSVPYLKKHLTGTKPKMVVLKNEGHFLPWKRFDLIKKIILAQKR